MSAFLTAPSESRSERRPTKADGQINVHESDTRKKTRVARAQDREHWETELEPLSRDERWEMLKKNRLCANCKKLVACGKDGCLLKHHPLLHKDQIPTIQNIQQPVHAHQRLTSATTMFRIVPLTLHNKERSIDTPGELQERYAHLRETALEGYHAAVPRILIGVDNSKLGLPLEICEGKWTEPVATRTTRLGWTVHGNNKNATDTTSDANTSQHCFHACRCSPDRELHLMVKHFFSMESYGVRKVETLPESAEEIDLEAAFYGKKTKLNYRTAF